MDKPIIAPATNIACVMGTISINDDTVLWVFNHYSGMLWDSELNEIQLCGSDFCMPYEALRSSPFFDIEEYQEYSAESIDGLIKSGFYLLVPINTQKMGVTEKECFIHDIVISEKIKEYYNVYDFWRPEFIWKKKDVCANDVIMAIDYHNTKLNNKILAFKKKEKASDISNEDLVIPPISILKVYDLFAEFVTNLRALHFLPVTSFQILGDHLNLLRETSKNQTLLAKAKIEDSKIINNIALSMAQECVKLRNLVMKLWMMQNEKESWKDIIVSRLKKIKSMEQSFWECFIL